MTLPPEVAVALIAFGGVVTGVIGTIIGAVLSNRSASKKAKVDSEVGMTNAQRDWVSMQIESMRTEIVGNRSYYESVIAAMQLEHKAELKKQEEHCQGRLDALTQQVSFLTKQLRFYTQGMHKGPGCIEIPSEFDKA